MKRNREIQWWSSPRKVLRTILVLDDTPHQIALGTAIGMFIAMTPTVGIQMILVMVISFLTRPLLRFNRIAALVAVYVSNPVTMVPLYWFNYKIGCLLLLDPSTLTRQYFSQFHEMTWWAAMVRTVVEIGAPLLVGSLVVAAVASILTYPFIRWLLRSVSGPTTASDKATQKEPVSSVAE